MHFKNVTCFVFNQIFETIYKYKKYEFQQTIIIIIHHELKGRFSKICKTPMDNGHDCDRISTDCSK